MKTETLIRGLLSKHTLNELHNYILVPQGNVFSDVKNEKSGRTLAVPINIMQYSR